MIERSRLARRSIEVAPELLGATVTSTVGGSTVTVRLTEVEAYEGAEDPASHAFRGPTKRNQVMFGDAGHLYCYFVYGMHWCANITCGLPGTASAVLLRAGEVIDGFDTARGRSAQSASQQQLARGPARLARALGLTGVDTGVDLLDPASPVRLESLGSGAGFVTGPRVGIRVAADRPWRFWLPDEASVSAFRPGARRARGAGANSTPAGSHAGAEAGTEAGAEAGTEAGAEAGTEAGAVPTADEGPESTRQTGSP